MNILLISMVRNESKIIKRCLESLMGVCTGFCFLDTGSTDDTIEIIKEFLKTNRGCLVQEPFIDFGTSRTRSFQICQEYAKSKNYNLKEWYGLLIDADMILNVNKSIFTLDTSYTTLNVIQKAGDLQYYNTRLIRLSENWKSVGVTHEYWQCADPTIFNLPFEMINIIDVNDGGCKADKFERDIKLLERGLMLEPKNHRYHFYLAQSYESINNKEKAIEHYKKRLELGGWFEETYVTYLRLGDIVEKDEDKIFYWLKAHEVDQDRAEHFYRLSRHFRIKADNNIASFFAREGKKIPYPKDRMLFIQNDVYNFRLDEEISIACNYTKDKTGLGFSTCNDLALRLNIHDESANLAFFNLQFYVEKIKGIQKTEWQLMEREVGFKESSCSLIYYPNETFIGIQRTVNYTMKGVEYICDGPVRTTNYLIRGKFREIQSAHKIEVLVEKKRSSPVKDLEDLRIVEYCNRYYAIGTTNEYGINDFPSQVLCLLDSNFNISKILQLFYEENRIQKNWCPFMFQDRFCCIYGYDPFIVLEINVDTGECREIINCKQPIRLINVRGSSSPVLIEGFFYQVVHIVYYEPYRRYMHRIIKYEPENMKIQDISKPFFFESFGIEFCLGLYGNTLENTFIHYSVSDNSSNVLKINLKNLFDFSKSAK